MAQHASTTRAQTIRASYRRSGESGWTGVVRLGRMELVECGHTHANRDMTTARGEAATVCARMILRGAQLDATAQHRAAAIRTAWQRLTSAAGFAVPVSTIEKAKADAPKAAAAYLAKVAVVRAALAEQQAATAPEEPPATTPAPEIGEMPAWML